MRAINHALTGAAIGLAVGNPWVAAPAAVASHFVLDAVPHYGSEIASLKTLEFRNLLILDAILCVVLVLVLAAGRPEHWLLAAVCAFLATAPDFMWTRNYLRARRGKSGQPSQGIAALLHSKIQWFERPIGAVVELAWVFTSIFIIALLVA